MIPRKYDRSKLASLMHHMGEAYFCRPNCQAFSFISNTILVTPCLEFYFSVPLGHRDNRCPVYQEFYNRREIIPGVYFHLVNT